jgi:hypothetical protein
MNEPFERYISWKVFSMSGTKTNTEKDRRGSRGEKPSHDWTFSTVEN